MKWALLDFGFSFSNKQKIVAAGEQGNEKEVASVDNDGWEARRSEMFVGGFSWFC